MACAIRPSNVRVYQFHHFGKQNGQKYFQTRLTFWQAKLTVKPQAWHLCYLFCYLMMPPGLPKHSAMLQDLHSPPARLPEKPPGWEP